MYKLYSQRQNTNQTCHPLEYDKIPHKTINSDFVLSGGEDYALVVCLDKEDFKYSNNSFSIIGFVIKRKAFASKPSL